jgi:Ca2+-binding RTX toxin-like protein
MNRLLALLIACVLLLGAAGAVGVAQAREINGNSRSNTLNGTNRKDTIKGGRGNDRIDGRGGNDTLVGGSGNDTITGGSGGDIFSGGNGNDTIHAQDATVDRIICGAGRDVVYADAREAISADCEDVRR